MNNMKTIIRKHFLLGLFSLITFHSCKKEYTSDSISQTSDSTTTVSIEPAEPEAAAKLMLQSFPMPAEVEGCSCYFARNQKEYENEQYVYVDDYGNNAYIKLDGHMIKIPMEEGDFDPSNFSKVLEDSEYRISMSGKKTSEQDETMMFTGQLAVLIKKENRTITTPVYGECGC